MTGLSCTPKVHTVCRHLIPFITSNLQSRHGLGVVSEQALESCHQSFKKVWRMYQCHSNNTHYPRGLHQAVCDFNVISVASENSAEAVNNFEETTQ